MNTGLAQLVALTAHGNVALRSSAHYSRLENTTLFRFVGALSFGVAAEAEPNDPVTPDAWFRSLAQRGIVRLYLVRLPPEPEAALSAYDRSAFANGEQAAIAAVDRQGRMELWVPQWISVEQHGGKSAWVLRYRGFHGGAWSEALKGRSVADVTTALREVLKEIAVFAADNGLERWADNFESAASSLGPTAADHSADLLPETAYGPDARRLLTAAMSGWVFGGMGSWNDTGPANSDEYPRYEELTQQLYDTIMDALVASANALAPA
jgi:hypothetical protein